MPARSGAFAALFNGAVRQWSGGSVCLHAQTVSSVCFDDLPKGIYEIKEVGDTPCGWCRNGEPQEDGCVQLGSQDVIWK